ncbi:hypothetical protein [Ehrlichia ruminantium]|uniref:hypothetical protein n=1 Tax=Ehrlichia ruminantium TaxID=779 RepID=UPI0015CF70D6|nr:hypothetical protein [Ehrlichia ruminantium]UOD98258.1 hypothetical protein IMW64_02120 [Ehrlichia ruminantium]UOE00077.1 hypothetical protein IMW62_02155 [Ehrlichia ruminantium]
MGSNPSLATFFSVVTLGIRCAAHSLRVELINDSIVNVIVNIMILTTIHRILIIGPRGKLSGPLLFLPCILNNEKD